ncbi:hypothetical protein QX776_07365 [Alteromonadaceae bacterium BrNp21-10]|nr:hypothetical protein [Alteromonadaceae bacterium BrNp21-10]
MTEKIKIDNDLIKEAEAALTQYPQSVTEQIEKWIYIGKAVAQQLSERDLVELQLGNGTLIFKLEKSD